MTIALKENAGRPGTSLVRRINLALVVFLVFYLAIGLLQPSYLEPAGAMNFCAARRPWPFSRLGRSSCS